MAQSIKKRMAASHIGHMSDRELRQLFSAALVDLTALRTTVASLVTAHNAAVTDLQKISNNTGAANNTVQVSSAAVAVASALTLTA